MRVPIILPSGEPDEREIQKDLNHLRIVHEGFTWDLKRETLAVYAKLASGRMVVAYVGVYISEDFLALYDTPKKLGEFLKPKEAWLFSYATRKDVPG